MKRVIASAVIGLTLLGGTATAFAATTSKNPNQADLATLKQLHQQEVNVNKQIKHEKQAIKTDLAKKFAVTKKTRNQIKTEKAAVKPIRQQLTTLKEQLKKAKQNKADKATIANLKQKMKSTKAQLKAKMGPIKTQTAALKKENEANKQLNTQLTSIRKEIKSTNGELKNLGKQRKALNTKLKTDRQAKNKTAIQADLTKAISTEQSVLHLKQKLLQEEQQMISIVTK
jgi:chromosome segregation ATPase